ncbi:hypothetical protein [Acinetobacter bereziniae]|uniref:hypothetical protein n=1 Tax=Acinetobacter bereziniae TaxID=106648 RepID=UPI0012500126|nr:hypothetical protein [Acinetobacter bereziniae]
MNNLGFCAIFCSDRGKQMSNNKEILGFEKLTEILTENEIDLLEDFREELSPRFISGCGHRPEMSNELVKILFHLVNEKLVSVLNDDLPREIRKAIGQVA